MAPKEIPVLVPSICEYVTLHGKGDFVDVIKAKDHKVGWEDYPALNSWSWYNNMYL